MKVARLLRPLLPARLRNKVPAGGSRTPHRFEAREHRRKVLLLGTALAGFRELAALRRMEEGSLSNNVVVPAEVQL